MISPLWLVKCETERANLVNQLIISNSQVHQENVIHHSLSKDERYALLCSEFKNIARITSLTPENTEKVKTELSQILNQLQCNEMDASRY